VEVRKAVIITKAVIIRNNHCESTQSSDYYKAVIITNNPLVLTFNLLGLKMPYGKIDFH